MQTSKGTAPRRLEIDGLRAMAAIWVMFDHFGLSARVGMHYGFLAVRLMLVLSAYFAARQLWVLWGSKTVDWSVKSSKLVHYYSSRVIRLGLMAYATILIAVALNVEGARGTWRWHAAFATNEWIVKYGDWPGSLSHFWSLAVQMQFLLLLPLVILLVGRRGIWPAIAGGIVAAIIHRTCAVYGGGGELVRWMPIANSLDAFCLGVGLAWVERERPMLFAKLQSAWLCLGAVACLGVVHWLRGHAYHTPFGLLTETGESVALMVLFGAMLGGRNFGPVGALFRTKPLVKLGAASLSLYALHPIVEPTLRRILFTPDPRWAFLNGPGFGLLAAAVSLLVAMGAFWVIEIPARKLVTIVEPILTRLFAAFNPENTKALFRWNLQYSGIIGLMMVLLYTASSPLRIPPSLEGHGDPIADSHVEEAPLAYPIHIDDTENLDVA